MYNSDIIKFFPKNLNLKRVTALNVPIMVTNVAEDIPIIREFISPEISVLELNNFSYHFKENPFHTAPVGASLKENTINTIKGRYKNTYTKKMYNHCSFDVFITAP